MISGENILHFLVLITGCTSAGKLGTSEIYRVTNVATVSLRGYQPDEEKVAEIRKLLCCGTFYYSWSNDPRHKPIDLTLACQKSAGSVKSTKTDNRFFWNRMLFIPFIRWVKIRVSSKYLKNLFWRSKLVKFLAKKPLPTVGQKTNYRKCEGLDPLFC